MNRANSINQRDAPARWDQPVTDSLLQPFQTARLNIANRMVANQLLHGVGGMIRPAGTQVSER